MSLHGATADDYSTTMSKSTDRKQNATVSTDVSAIAKFRHSARLTPFPFDSAESLASLFLSYFTDFQLLTKLRLVNKTFYFASEIAPYWWTRVEILKPGAAKHLLEADRDVRPADRLLKCSLCRGVWSLHFKLMTGGVVIPLGKVKRSIASNASPFSLEFLNKFFEDEQEFVPISDGLTQSLSNENCAPALNDCSGADVNNRHAQREETAGTPSTLKRRTSINSSDPSPLLKLSMRSEVFGCIKHLTIQHPFCGVGRFFRSLLTGGAILLESILIEDPSGDFPCLPNSVCDEIKLQFGHDLTKVRKLKNEYSRLKRHQLKHLQCPVEGYTPNRIEAPHLRCLPSVTNDHSEATKRSGTYAMENDRACEDSNSVEAADGRKCSRYPYLTNKGYTRATEDYRLKFVKCIIIETEVGTQDLLEMAYCLCGEDLLHSIRTSAKTKEEVTESKTSQTESAPSDADKQPVQMSEGLRLEVLIFCRPDLNIIKLPILSSLPEVSEVNGVLVSVPSPEMFDEMCAVNETFRKIFKNFGTVGKKPLQMIFGTWGRNDLSHLDISTFDIISLIVGCCARNTLRVFTLGELPSRRYIGWRVEYPIYCSDTKISEAYCSKVSSACDSLRTSEELQASRRHLKASTTDSITTDSDERAFLLKRFEEPYGNSQSMFPPMFQTMFQPSRRPVDGVNVSLPVDTSLPNRYLNMEWEDTLERDRDLYIRGTVEEDPDVMENMKVATHVAAACVPIVNRVRIPRIRSASEKKGMRIPLLGASSEWDMFDTIMERHRKSLNCLVVDDFKNMVRSAFNRRFKELSSRVDGIVLASLPRGTTGAELSGAWFDVEGHQLYVGQYKSNQRQECRG